jgi:hypothetical protein
MYQNIPVLSIASNGGWDHRWKGVLERAPNRIFIGFVLFANSICDPAVTAMRAIYRFPFVTTVRACTKIVFRMC